MTKQDQTEVEITQKMIQYLKKGYGECNIEDDVDDCVACQAMKVVLFLQKHIDMIYEWDAEV